MTYVCNPFNSLLNSKNFRKFFSVEIITFSNGSFTEEVEAYTAEEAQEIAASMYDDVDYTMIQAVYCA